MSNAATATAANPPGPLSRRRNECAKEDLYYPHPVIQDILWWTLYQARLGHIQHEAARPEA